MIDKRLSSALEHLFLALCELITYSKDCLDAGMKRESPSLDIEEKLRLFAELEVPSPGDSQEEIMRKRERTLDRLRQSFLEDDMHRLLRETRSPDLSRLYALSSLVGKELQRLRDLE